LNNLIASSTCLSVDVGDNSILAKDSETRIIASSCLYQNKNHLIVIGIADLDTAFSPSPNDLTLALISTKCEESFWAASVLNLGAHFLVLDKIYVLQ
jgi:hypothetical protein